MLRKFAGAPIGLLVALAMLISSPVSASAATSPAFAAPGTFTCKAATAANEIPSPPPLWELSGKRPSAAEMATANATKSLCPEGQVPSAITTSGVVSPDATPATETTTALGAPRGTSVPSEQSATSPCAHEGKNKGCSCQEEGCYWWAENTFLGTAIGMEYTTEVSEPHVSSFGLAHSIDQLAVGAGTEGNQYTIEAGWDVDPAYFTSSTANPHFFIFVNPDKYGSESCYDCHFTPAAEAKITPGEALEPSTTNFTIGVKYSGGNWWIWAGTQWIGYVSGSAWGDHFTKGTSESNYGEVFDRESDPTTQMGDGQPGASANATPMTAPVILLSESSYETTGLEAYTTNSSLYSIGDINAGRTEWHFGGNGLNPPEQWYGPLALGMKTLGSGPAAAVTGSGEQVVVWKGENGGLWEADYNGTWHGPFEIPGMAVLGSQPTVAITPSGEQVVFWKGGNGGLWEADYNGTWHGPFEIPGMAVLGSQPSVAVSSKDEQVVFWKGGNGGLWEGYYNGTWHGPLEVPGMAVMGSQPTVADSPSGEQNVWWEGGENSLYEAYYNGTWHGPVALGMKSLASAPSAAITSGDEQLVFWKGENGGLLKGYYNGTWHGPVEIPGMATLGAQPAAAVNSKDEEEVWWEGGEGSLWEAFYGEMG